MAKYTLKWHFLGQKGPHPSFHTHSLTFFLSPKLRPLKPVCGGGSTVAEFKFNGGFNGSNQSFGFELNPVGRNLFFLHYPTIFPPIFLSKCLWPTAQFLLPPYFGHQPISFSKSPFLWIPNKPINFFRTLFRVSNWSCSHLPVLKPCGHAHL